MGPVAPSRTAGERGAGGSAVGSPLGSAAVGINSANLPEPLPGGVGYGGAETASPVASSTCWGMRFLADS